MAAAQEREVEPTPVSDFAALKGRGVQGVVAGTAVYAGGPRLLEHLEIQLPEAIASFSQTAGEKGQAVIYLIRDDAVVAAFALADG